MVLVLLAFVVGLVIGMLVLVILVADQPNVAARPGNIDLSIQRLAFLLMFGMLLVIVVVAMSFFWLLLDRPSTARAQEAPRAGHREREGQEDEAARRLHDHVAVPPAGDLLNAPSPFEYAQGFDRPPEFEPPQEPQGPLPPAPKVDPAQFEVKEPEDKSDPARHIDRVALEEKGWAIVGASRRGRGHEHDGKYREDWMAAKILGEWHLVAVCDGGGAYSLARVGARVAAQAALAAMENELRRLVDITRKQGIPIPGGDSARMILRAGLGRAYDAAHAEAAQRNVDPKLLRTTLLLLLHRAGPGRDLVAGAQIGDGLIAARDANGQLIPLGTPDTGPSNNEVLFLQDVDPAEWEKRITVSGVAGPCQCLAMTDGVSDDFIPYEQNLDRLLQPLFTEVLAKKRPGDAANAMVELLGYQRQGSFDDRTLVVVYKRG